MSSVSTSGYKVITHIKFILSLGFIRIIFVIQMTLQAIFSFTTTVNHFISYSELLQNYNVSQGHTELHFYTCPVLPSP